MENSNGLRRAQYLAEAGSEASKDEADSARYRLFLQFQNEAYALSLTRSFADVGRSFIGMAQRCNSTRRTGAPYVPFTFTQLSRSPTVRLNTRRPGLLSGSRMK
jgi:hypothetical protein